MERLKKTRLWPFLLAALCALLLVVGTGRATYVTTNLLKQDAASQLTALTARTARSVSLRISEQLGQLERLAAAADALGGPEAPEAQALASGEGLALYSRERAAAAGALCRRALAGERAADAAGEPPSLVLAVPVRPASGGQISGVLACRCGASAYPELADFPLDSGFACSFLVDGGGAPLLGEASAQAVLPERSSGTQALWDDMAAGRSGLLEYRPEGGEAAYFAYAPLELNGWYLVSRVALSVIDGPKLAIRGTVTAVAALSILLLSLLFAALLFSRHRRAVLAKQSLLTDSLTALPNLRSLQEHFSDLRSRRGWALILVQFHGFHQVTDIFGSAAATHFLREASGRLTGALGPGELAARISEAHFALLLRDEGGQEALERRVGPLLTSLTDIPVTDGAIVYDYRCFLRAGCCMLDSGEEDFQDASRRAQAVLDNQPSRPADGVAWGWFNARYQDRLALQSTLAAEIPRAIEKSEFIPYFQPQYNVLTKEIVGAELLARWEHPGHGILLPGLFLPMLEAAGCALELDLIIVEQACRMISGWLRQGLVPVTLSVNISRLNLHRADFPDRLMGIIRQYGVPANLISLELDERAIVDNADKVLTVSRRLKSEGFLLSMDNFGRGDSSLALLRDLPVDILKLDRGFLFNSGTAMRRKSVLQHTVAMAHELGIWLIAEGVENAQQKQAIEEAGCRLMQGYFFSQPMSEQDFAQLIFAEGEQTHTEGDIFLQAPQG